MILIGVVYGAIAGKDGGRDQCGAGFCGGCGIPVYHNDRRDAIVLG